jgi:hypothetical protein
MQPLWRLVARSLLKPRLLLMLPRAAWRFRRRHWYRRPPFLPLPSAEYVRWRLHTAFGDEATTPSVRSLESYLHWTESMQEQRGALQRPDSWKQSSGI